MREKVVSETKLEKMNQGIQQHIAAQRLLAKRADIRRDKKETKIGSPIIL